MTHPTGRAAGASVQVTGGGSPQKHRLGADEVAFNVPVPLTPNAANQLQVTVRDAQGKISPAVNVTVVHGEAKLPPPARGFRLSFRANRQQLYNAWNAIANLADKAGKVRIDVAADTPEPLDPAWLRNAVLEPLEEAEIEAETRAADR